MRYEIVPFHDRHIHTVEKDGDIIVIMKPVVEASGLDWSSQSKRIRRDPVLSQGMVIMTIPSAGGVQEMMGLKLNMFIGWLVGISTNAIKDTAIRDFVIRLQIEAFDVLTRHFFGDRAKDKRPFPNASERVTLQREVNRLMERLRRARNREERRVIHDMLKQTTAQLGIEAPPIEALGFDAPESDDVTRPFWNAITALTARGVNCNLSLKPDQTLAINIKWMEQQCQAHGIAFRASPTLKSALRETMHPRFVDADTCRTALGKLMHCYLFSVPEGPPLLRLN